MNYERHQHSYVDDELITGAQLAKQLGVSGAAVSKATSKGRLDTFKNSRGEKCYHKVVSAQQFTLKKDRSKVTTPTRGQMAAGYDNLDAQAMAHVLGNENPQAPKPVSAPVQGMEFSLRSKRAPIRRTFGIYLILCGFASGWTLEKSEKLNRFLYFGPIFWRLGAAEITVYVQKFSVANT